MNSNSLYTDVAAQSVITRVVDSTGTSIPNPGTTRDSALTLSGTGPGSSVVLILDSDVPIGSASVLPVGTWEISVAAAVGIHSYTARTTDGTVSQPWLITVVNASVKPEIVSVTDSNGVPIPPNSSTPDASVTLVGTAAAESLIEIYDSEVSWGTAPAPGGVWTKSMAGLALGEHRFTAQTTDGQGVSAPWIITRISVDLVIDTSPLILNGLLCRAWTTPPNPPVGAFADRPASGGMPPYRYDTNNYSVATVDSLGRVVSVGNGNATITVTDQVGASASYSVAVSNVRQLFGTGLFSDYISCGAAAIRDGGDLPVMDEWRLVWEAYGPAGSQIATSPCWSDDQEAPSPVLSNIWVFSPHTGQRELRYYTVPTNGFGIRRH